MMRTYLLVAAVTVLLSVPAFGSADQVPSRLENLITEALTNNPDLLAAQARWQMFTRKVAPAESLDDPQLGLALSNYPVDSFQADQTPMTGNELKLTQAFPFPGKLAAKGDMAREQARWYQGAYQDARVQVAARVKDAWYRLFFQDQAIAVTEQDLKLLDQLIRLAGTRYEVGDGLQQDVLKAQLERSKLMDRLFSERQQRNSVAADLNTLVGRSPDTPIAPLAEVVPTPVHQDTATLLQLAEQNRPLFRSYQALVERYRQQRKLAKLDYYPNFGVWASYRFRDDNLPDGGTDFASAGVSINLPLWREKRAAGVAEAESGIHMARRQYQDFRNKVRFGIEDGTARLEKDRKLLDLYRSGILPQARQTYQASLTAYQVGKVDALNLLDSLLKLDRYQVEYQRVLADHQRDVARLEGLTGVALGEPGKEPAR